MAHVDLNCDMGESYGAWHIGNDAAVLPFVTSVNIACGFHGGDPSVMRTTVRAAAAQGIGIGAHPGLPDLPGFGRRDMAVSVQEVYDMVVYQVGALQGVARAAGSTVRHVKPHGALYNMAAGRRDLADSIAQAVYDLDATLVLVGLSGSALIDAALARGLTSAREVFADRNYLADGSLVPRTSAGALITDVGEAAARAVRMVTQGRVRSLNGTDIAVSADTICIHGDAAGAPAFATSIRAALETEGVDVRSFGTSAHS